MKNTKEKYMGKKVAANNGQWMEVVEYRNYDDIDVRFEDGTTVKNTCYGNFKRGEIKNPNYTKTKMVGLINKTTIGQWMRIIDYVNACNITVQFEDGTIVYNQRYDSFKKGSIKNPNIKNNHAHRYLGKENISTRGQRMWVIAYRSADDIDVKFEDGSIVKTNCDNFRKGIVVNPNYSFSNQVSINEYVVFWYLSKLGFKKMNSGSLKELGFGKMEIDCYNEKFKIAIEYDGGKWHKKETKENFDLKKNQMCEKNGIYLIRIRECPLSDIKGSKNYFINSAREFSKSLELVLKKVLKEICKIMNTNCGIDINFKRDRCIISKDFGNKYKNSKIGETKTSKYGEVMTIVGYINAKDIDVDFGNGIIRKHVYYQHFKNGELRSSTIKEEQKKTRIGEIQIMKNGQKSKIIEYRNSMDIDIQCENGFIKKHTTYQAFKKGQVPRQMMKGK